MLDSIWQLLANYGLDVGEIAGGINSLIEVDAEGNVVGGSLAALADFPIIGMVLKAFASFAPAAGDTVA